MLVGLRYRRMFLVCVLCAWSLLLVVTVQAQSTLVVAPDGVYTTIDAALAAAQDGDVIEVHGGVYGAPLEINKSVALIGIDNPVIDGGGEGSLVLINAPDVVLQGFALRGSGEVMHHEDSAVVVQAAHVTIAENTIEDVLFGIYFAQADYGIARNNTVVGYDRDLAMRGDGLRVWYSNHVEILDNEISVSRDTLIWYSDNITVRGNHFHDNRYALHVMYSSNALMEDNNFSDNEVGAYLMYSQGLTLHDNILADNRGPSGYGLALKDMDEVQASGNLFAGNRAGLYVDNSPSLYEGVNTFTENVFAYNDLGVTMLPAVERNIFEGNIFLDNTQQAATHGRGDLLGNIWSHDGIGNYWSDYAGYDAGRDGIGDSPYRSEKLFESLTDTAPELRLFLYSPATQAVDFAAAAFPALRPQPRLIDEAPMMRYTLPPHFASSERHVSSGLLWASLGLIGLGAALGLLAFGVKIPARRGQPVAQFPTDSGRIVTHTG